MAEQLLTSIGVKKKGFKSIQGYEYEWYDYIKQKCYHLHDVNWAINFYFHMKGKINGYLFEAYENEKVVLNVDSR